MSDISNEEPVLDRRLAMGLMLALGGLAAGSEARAAAHVGRRPPAPPVVKDGLYLAIEAVLIQTREIWNSQDFGRLKEVWDADDPQPWYVPEEIEQPFFSWPQIERYWNPGRKTLKAFRWDFSNLRVKALADDLALAIFDHFYEISLAVGPPSPPTAGFDRCLALFRRKPEGWRHILYAQCPLGPDTYVRALRERIVRDDFAAFSDALGDEDG
jgi:hypothetical protein